MMTIRELSSVLDMSYEAARSLVNRRKNQLEGHISKIGGKLCLDDEAVDILIELRRKPASVKAAAARSGKAGKPAKIAKSKKPSAEANIDAAVNNDQKNHSTGSSESSKNIPKENSADAKASHYSEIESRLNRIEKLSEKLNKIDEIAAEIEKLEGASERLAKIDKIAAETEKLEGASERLAKIDEIAAEIEKLEGMSKKLSSIEEGVMNFDELKREFRNLCEKIEQNQRLLTEMSEKYSDYAAELDIRQRQLEARISMGRELALRENRRSKLITASIGVVGTIVVSKVGKSLIMKLYDRRFRKGFWWSRQSNCDGLM